MVVKRTPASVAVILALCLGGIISPWTSSLAAEQAKEERLTEVLRILDTAIDSAAKIEDEGRKDLVVPQLAGAQALAGDLPGALKTAAAAKDHEGALQAIARAQALKGDSDGALKTAEQIPEGESRNYALTDVVLAKARAQDFKGVRTILETRFKTMDPLVVAFVVKEITMMQAKSGDFAGALKTAEAIEDPFLLAYISGAQAQSGDKAGSDKSLQRAMKSLQIFQRQAKGSAWYQIASGQAEAGDVEGAATSAASIQNNNEKASVLRLIAIAQMKARRFPGALSIAQRIENRPIKAFVLAEIALTQAEAGDLPGAQNTVSQAIQITGTVNTAAFKEAADLRIGKAQALSGNRDQAARTFQELINFIRSSPGLEYGRESALANVAAAQAAAKLEEADTTFQEAVESALSLKENYQKSNGLEAVARMQAKAGSAKQALEWAQKLADPECRTYALLGTAQGLLEQVYPEPGPSDWRLGAFPSLAGAR